MPLNVGSRIAHYDVTALIGEGGMGQVYQVAGTKLGGVNLRAPRAVSTDNFEQRAQVTKMTA